MAQIENAMPVRPLLCRRREMPDPTAVVTLSPRRGDGSVYQRAGCDRHRLAYLAAA
jgi:hypothetical protein